MRLESRLSTLATLWAWWFWAIRTQHLSPWRRWNIMCERRRARNRAPCWQRICLMEVLTHSLANEITAAIPIPTIGIGSWPECDGQILVTDDLLGTFPWFTPKFVKPKLNVAEQMRAAIRDWKDSI